MGRLPRAGHQGRRSCAPALPEPEGPDAGLPGDRGGHWAVVGVAGIVLDGELVAMEAVRPQIASYLVAWGMAGANHCAEFARFEVSGFPS